MTPANAPVSARPFAIDLPWLQFACGFLAHPTHVASICPSSRRLQRQIATLPAVRRARTIVELGPGLGETTRALLAELPPGAQLLAIEIVPQFVRQLREIRDQRLRAAEGSALELARLLGEHRFTRPDVIVSGIPFSAISPQQGRALVSTIHESLAPGGTFIAYQLRDRICELAADHFGDPQVTFVPWNLPPLWIYQWTKSGSVEELGRHCRTAALARL